MHEAVDYSMHPRLSITAEEYDELVQLWTRPSRWRPDFPARRRLKSRLVALRYILDGFEPGKEYSEAEVNSIVQQRNLFDIDYVQLRRHMVDYGMLDRAADGSRYRRTHGYLVLANWDPAIPGTRPFHLEET